MMNPYEDDDEVDALTEALRNGRLTVWNLRICMGHGERTTEMLEELERKGIATRSVNRYGMDVWHIDS